jgi:hypothetical protein
MLALRKGDLSFGMQMFENEGMGGGAKSTLKWYLQYIQT